MSYKGKMIYSENPYVDIVVHNIKKLGLDTILKMNGPALANETLSSRKNADILIASTEGTLTFDMLDDVSSNALTKAGIPESLPLHFKCLINKDNVPLDKRDAVLKAQREEYIEAYTEENSYYRMLQGLPALDYDNVYLDDTMVPSSMTDIDISIPLHEMTYDQIMLLDINGVLDKFYEEDTKNRTYVKHILRPVDPYTARKASPFSVLYIPTIDSTEIYNEYRDRLTINRSFTMQTVYSDAYAYESDYYDNFIAIFIILNTMADVIARVNEFITRKEVFDIRTVRYIFESYGVDYFPEIPLKFQHKMVKNLHTLLKFKSTPKCMVDICSLFGFKNITIFKYYLLKSRKYSRTKDEFSFTGDPEEDYDMKFVKIPIGEPMDKYIRDSTYYVDYDEITEGDPTWDGGLDHHDVKLQHLNAEYNYTRTKYLSIESLYEISKMAIQQCYFFNMLYDNVKLEGDININIPYISPTAELNITDIFVFLTCLTFYYNNVEDEIMITQKPLLKVMGFNFKADLAVIAADLEKMGYKLDAKEAFEKFNIPTTNIPNLTQLMNIFTNNLDVREVLVRGMREADNLRVYNTYKYLYDSLMTIDLTTEYFTNPNTHEYYIDPKKGFPTYTEYLKHKNPLLYYKLVEIENMDDVESKAQSVANLIDNITYVLEKYIDTDKFAALFYSLPVVSIEAVKGYIKTVIDFYKSYKVHFLGINTLYYYDDKNEGWFKIIDWILLNRYFEKEEIIPVIERVFDMSVSMTKVDKYEIIERVYLDISTRKDLDMVEKARLKDILRDLISHLIIGDAVGYKDTVEAIKPYHEYFKRMPDEYIINDNPDIKVSSETKEVSPITEDTYKLVSIFSRLDTYQLIDKEKIIHFHNVDLTIPMVEVLVAFKINAMKKESIGYYDTLKFRLAGDNFTDEFSIDDTYSRLTGFEFNERVIVDDFIKSMIKTNNGAYSLESISGYDDKDLNASIYKEDDVTIGDGMSMTITNE